MKLWMHKNQFPLSFDNYILNRVLTCCNYNIKVLRLSNDQKGHSGLLRDCVNVIKMFTVFQLHHRKIIIMCMFLFISNWQSFDMNKIMAIVSI